MSLIYRLSYAYRLSSLLCLRNDVSANREENVYNITLVPLPATKYASV